MLGTSKIVFNTTELLSSYSNYTWDSEYLILWDRKFTKLVYVYVKTENIVKFDDIARNSFYETKSLFKFNFAYFALKTY